MEKLTEYQSGRTRANDDDLRSHEYDAARFQEAVLIDRTFATFRRAGVGPATGDTHARRLRDKYRSALDRRGERALSKLG